MFAAHTSPAALTPLCCTHIPLLHTHPQASPLACLPPLDTTLPLIFADITHSPQPAPPRSLPPDTLSRCSYPPLLPTTRSCPRPTQHALPPHVPPAAPACSLPATRGTAQAQVPHHTEDGLRRSSPPPHDSYPVQKQNGPHCGPICGYPLHILPV